VAACSSFLTAMSGWLAESQVLEKFESSLGKSQGADAKEFAEASLALISVFDLITGMGLASGDMKGNANTILKAATAKPGSTLEALVDEETAGKSPKELSTISGDGTKVSCALLWLGRALAFILKMLDVLQTEKGKSMSQCVMAGYEVSLRPHHGMMIRGTFSVAVKAAPNRETFIAKLGPSEEDVFAKIGAKSEALNALVSGIQKYLESKDATSFKA